MSSDEYSILSRSCPLYIKAISGGKKKNDRIDSKTLVNLMRGNLFPPAYAYPREMRPTRDLLRRRNYYVSFRSGANTHIHALYEIHKIDRFPAAQNFSSYCRVVKCERTSNGKSTGGSNAKIGNPYLKWAFNQIIFKAQSQSPLIKRYYERLICKHGFSKARGIMGHKFAVAVYYMSKKWLSI